MLLWLATAAVALIAARRLFLGYPPAPLAVHALRAREYHTVRAAAQVIYPEGGAIDASGESARVALHADRFVAAQSASTRRLMRLLLVLVEHATLVFPARGPRGWRRFSSLDPTQQLDYLHGWRQSESHLRRLVFTSLRAIVTMGYFADPEVLRALDLLPAPLVAERR